MNMPTWRELIAASGLPRAEARGLAVHAAQRNAAWLIAHDTDEAEPGVVAVLRDLLARRQRGEPLAYIIGEREFYGLSLRVTPEVLIPRPETELLVELVIERLPKNGRLLDVGTGSGAIAIAVAVQRPDAQIVACDISPGALAVARDNAERLGADVHFVASDGLTDVPGQAFDVIASNPPYIAEGDPHLSQGDLRFEPAIALHCGRDGLDMIRRLVRDAHAALRPGGWLLCEHGYDQGEACVSLWRSTGFGAVEDRRDLAGMARVCIGLKK